MDSNDYLNLKLDIIVSTGCLAYLQKSREQFNKKKDKILSYVRKQNLAQKK
jgi:hypothetical protein